jgi:peptide deformylase
MNYVPDSHLVPPIRQYPDMLLREVCRSTVDDDLPWIKSNLVPKLFQLAVAAGGIGLSAPQVGHAVRVFCFYDDDDNLRIAINPVVETEGELVRIQEGCLSLGRLRTFVDRPGIVKMSALDEYGESYILEVEGRSARVIQHENDHLDGRLIVDHGLDLPLLSTIRERQPSPSRWGYARS